jgi:hypothetical protein
MMKKPLRLHCLPEAGSSLLRALGVAILVIATGTACSRGPEHRGSPPPDWTLDEVRRLTDVTDKTVSLARTVSEGGEDVSRLETQVVPLIEAVQSTIDLVSGRRNASRLKNELDGHEYADVSACVEGVIINIGILPVEVSEIKEASAAGNAEAIEQAQRLVGRIARDNVECATLLTEFLGGTKSQAAIERLGAATPVVYASAAAFRAVAGLELKALLEDQIAANERIVGILKQACEQAHSPQGNGAISKVPSRCVPHTLALHALPKLKSALSLISATGA